MSVIENARASAAGRRRQRELASDWRSGAWSRRQIRASERQWMRRNWKVVSLLGGVFGSVAAIAQLTLHPAFLRPYVVTALVVSCAWLVHHVMVITSGVAGKLAGILGETWTNDELRGLRRSGWRVVNHVMLVRRDVDHVLLGPAGFFVVDSKVRSEWRDSRRSAAEFASLAKDDARSIAGRIGRPRETVGAIVALWGGGIATLEPAAFTVGDVTFCAGTLLRAHLESLPHLDLTPAELQAAFQELDGYVRRRDADEIAQQGDFVRDPVEAVYDGVLVAVAAIVTLYAEASLAQLRPIGVWSGLLAAVLLVVSVWIRRRKQSRLRLQRTTAGLMAVAGFFAALLPVLRLITVFT